MINNNFIHVYSNINNCNKPLGSVDLNNTAVRKPTDKNFYDCINNSLENQKPYILCIITQSNKIKHIDGTKLFIKLAANPSYYQKLKEKKKFTKIDFFYLDFNDTQPRFLNIHNGIKKNIEGHFNIEISNRTYLKYIKDDITQRIYNPYAWRRAALLEKANTLNKCGVLKQASNNSAVPAEKNVSLSGSMIKKNTTYENANPEQTDNQEDNPSTENAGNNYTYLKVDEGFIYSLLPFIEKEGFLPPHGIGAHISIISNKDAETYKITKLAESKISFTIKDFKILSDFYKPGTLRLAILEVESPEFKTVRKSAGIVDADTEIREYHITIGREPDMTCYEN